jgi:hypothetical protein
LLLLIACTGQERPENLFSICLVLEEGIHFYSGLMEEFQQINRLNEGESHA